MGPRSLTQTPLSQTPSSKSLALYPFLPDSDLQPNHSDSESEFQPPPRIRGPAPPAYRICVYELRAHDACHLGRLILPLVSEAASRSRHLPGSSAARRRLAAAGGGVSVGPPLGSRPSPPLLRTAPPSWPRGLFEPSSLPPRIIDSNHSRRAREGHAGLPAYVMCTILVPPAEFLGAREILRLWAGNTRRYHSAPGREDRKSHTSRATRSKLLFSQASFFPLRKREVVIAPHLALRLILDWAR